ncbi:MAG TPA: dihydroorotase family protein [Streptosporangiaceae bacterium]|nr:dihydroorotase family protein [Streptosporangiaceae bacterium]
MPPLDLLVKNVRVVRPDHSEVADIDIGVADGRFARLAPDIPASEAATVVDGQGRLAFPGVVDAHQHWGIYNPLAEDTGTESRASAQGGVTTGITYVRTGQYYLNQGGPYEEFFPKVLSAAEGRSYIDYAFHVAPMMSRHIDEIPLLIEQFGVTSFKIFMFYGGFGLHGASASQREFLMIPDSESYDNAHFEFVMRGIQAAREQMPGLAADISLSLHCETAEIMRAYTSIVQKEGRLHGLEAYSASRPPHSEGLAVSIASYLAHETGLPTINLLHLSSAKALESALIMARAFPHIDFRREVTVGHLLADFHTASGLGGKVNPPLRSRQDVEALWEHVLAGDVDWVVSDHACCRDEMKFGDPRDDVFAAKSGFGGTEYLLPGLISEGRKRGLSYQRVAQLAAQNPARRFGLHAKGTIAEGYDADFALVDPDSSWVVRAAESESTQEYTPFEGFEMSARVTDTFVRGHQVLTNGVITGQPQGVYLRRPVRRD